MHLFNQSRIDTNCDTKLFTKANAKMLCDSPFDDGNRTALDGVQDSSAGYRCTCRYHKNDSAWNLTEVPPRRRGGVVGDYKRRLAAQCSQGHDAHHLLTDKQNVILTSHI